MENKETKIDKGNKDFETRNEDTSSEQNEVPYSGQSREINQPDGSITESVNDIKSLKVKRDEEKCTAIQTESDNSQGPLRKGNVSFADNDNLIRLILENSDDLEFCETQENKISFVNKKNDSDQIFAKSQDQNKSAASISENRGQPKPKPNLSRGLLTYSLAHLLWKYPTIHQEVEVYPILTNRTVISTAKRQSQKLKQTLSKNPEKHRLSKEDPKIAALTTQTNRKSTKSLSVGEGTKEATRKSRNSKQLPRRSGAAGNRALQMHQNKSFEYNAAGRGSSAQSIYSDMTIVHTDPAQTHSILGALREKNETEEYKSCSAKIRRNYRKCSELCLHKCTCGERSSTLAFAMCITLVILFSIGAVVYPFIKVLRQ